MNNQQRTRLAALKASTGELLDWTASAEGPNAQVYAIEVSPDHSKVVIGGSFSTVNGSSKPGYGMALLSASTGEVLPMPVNDTVRTAGEKAAIFDIAVDEDGFYGTAYSAVGRLDEANLEGSFKADWNGNLIWLEPCHGDTYGIAPTKDTVYTVGHAHSCETIYGFPNMPEVRKDGQHPLYVRAMAFTNSPDITIRHQGVVDGYQDWSTSGLKSPTIIGWYPDLEAGKFTKTSQAAYKVDVTDSYVLMVGEFIEADGKVQQGIVRYPKRAGQPTLPPEGKAETLAAKAEVTTSGSVRVGFNATWDRDDPTLTYSLYRDDETTPVATRRSATPAGPSRATAWRTPPARPAITPTAWWSPTPAATPSPPRSRASRSPRRRRTTRRRARRPSPPLRRKTLPTTRTRTATSRPPTRTRPPMRRTTTERSGQAGPGLERLVRCRHEGRVRCSKHRTRP